MRFPFVSRERLDEAISVRESRITDLGEQVRALTEERKRLSDFIAVRSNNMSVYGLVNPLKEEEEAIDPKATEPDAVPPGRARQFAQRVQEKNEKQFRTEEAEAERVISSAIEAGKQAARAQA